MKKLLISSGMIVFVGAVAIGATGAFFSDSETSTGNTFTAGAIDLTVDSQQHYNGNTCVLAETDPNTYQWQGNSAYPVPGTPCDGTWTLTNLGPANKFFNFGDIKPGDSGEDTISLHIDNNPAWACADINVTKNDDVSTVDPETDAGDAVENPSDNFDGELAQNIQVFAWLDDSNSGTTPGDNVWQDGEKILIQPTPAFNILNSTTTIALADAVTNGGIPLPGGATNYIGLAWCAGVMTANSGNITCNGATMDNLSQTDSMTADITLRVEQSRNNGRFVCNVPSNQPITGVTNGLDD